MSSEDWPSLQESEIEALASAKVFARGRALFDDEALEDLARQGKQLSAHCSGSDEESYTLSIEVSEQGVQKTSCTCPYEYDGICKHLVALLLAYAHTPEAFRAVEDSPSNQNPASALFLELQGRERDELAQLIVQLVETEPKLRAVVRRLLKNRLTDGEVGKTKRAVETLMRKIVRRGYESDFTQIRRDMMFQLRGAASLEAMRPGDAARLYLSIIQGLMAEGNEPFNWDEGSLLVDFSQQCVVALSRLLPLATDARREECLKVLCQAYLFDFKLGGYGFVRGVEAILEDVTDNEWKAVELQLDAFLQSHPPAPALKRYRPGEGGPPKFLWDELATRVSDYGRDNVLSLQAKRLEKRQGPQAANAFLIAYGTPKQQVNAHLSNGDFDTATHLARQHFTPYAGLVRSFADQLNDAGQWSQAREWAEQNNLTEWLAQHSVLRGEPDALKLNIDLFRAQPNAAHWFQVMQLAPESPDALTIELWEFLEKRSAFATQFDIRLQEGNTESALEIWPRLGRWEREARHDHLAVAAKIASEAMAVHLWNTLAESLIGHRSRDAYRMAAKALIQVKKLLEKADRSAEWQEQSAALRARYPTLRALKEELDRAKL